MFKMFLRYFWILKKLRFKVSHMWFLKTVSDDATCFTQLFITNQGNSLQIVDVERSRVQPMASCETTFKHGALGALLA